MCDAFIKGITDSGNEYIISDLYKMGFQTDMTEEEYLRDANYRNTPDVSEDVLAEQEKINSADAIAFIYPVFWTEAPAKLVGWFDRVWSYGFAYGEKTMKVLDKALILCSAGNPIERLEEYGLLDSMKRVMLGDRLFGRAKQTEFIVFDNTSRENELRERNWNANLQKAYEIGKGFCDDYLRYGSCPGYGKTKEMMPGSSLSTIDSEQSEVCRDEGKSTSVY